ncbi:MAG: hypothetical protein WC969_06940 [Elusimicrobiota bacterium]|jgi:hypothetical protein
MKDSISVAAFILVLGAGAAAAQFLPAATASPGSVPSGFNYQGRLEESGYPVTGAKSMTFRVYDALTGGNLLWSSAAQAISVQQGLFNTVISVSTTALAGGGDRFVEVQVDATILAPREQLYAVPYALMAKTIEGTLDISHGGLSVSSSPTAGAALFVSSFTGSVGIGTSAPSGLFSIGDGTMVVTQNGRVGIGTSDPQNHLELSGGNFKLNSSGGGASASPSDGRIVFDNQYDNAGSPSANKLQLFDNGAARYGLGVSNALGTGSLDYFSFGDHVFYGSHVNEGTPGGVLLRLMSTGHVGVNTATPNLLGRGGTQTTLTVSAPAFANLELASTAADANGIPVGSADFVFDANTVSADRKRLAAVAAYTQGAAAADRGGRLSLWTKVDGNILSERMRLSAAGDVTIYSTSTSVGAGAVGSAVASPSNGRLLFDNQYDNAGNASANKIVLYDDAVSYKMGLGVSAGSFDLFSGGKFRFFTGHASEATPGAESFSILSGPRIGVGTNSPATGLEVYRAATSTQISANNDSFSGTRMAGYNYRVDTSDLWQTLVDNTGAPTPTNTFSIQYNGGSATRYLNVTPAGRVGIGEPNPGATLHVTAPTSTSGDVLAVSTGTSKMLSITGAGDVYTQGTFISSRTIAVRVYNSAAIPTAINTVTPLTFNSERFDPVDMHSTTVNTGRLTAPIPGVYHITLSVEFAQFAGACFKWFAIVYNGATQIARNEFYSNGNSLDSTTLDALYYLNAGDYVSTEVRQTCGAVNIDAVGNYSPEFMMVRMP